MATEETAAPHWRRSSFCNHPNCVEVAPLGEAMGIRDSRDPDGPVLVVSASSWQRLIAGIKNEDQE